MTPEKHDTHSQCDIPLAALRTRRAQFLAEAARLFPWGEWEKAIEDCYPKRGTGRPRYPTGRLLRLWFLQRWFDLSDAALYEMALDSIGVREFLGLGLVWYPAPPDDETLAKFRRLLSRHGLAALIANSADGYLATQGWKVRPGKIAEAAVTAAREGGV